MHMKAPGNTDNLVKLQRNRARNPATDFKTKMQSADFGSAGGRNLASKFMVLECTSPTLGSDTDLSKQKRHRSLNWCTAPQRSTHEDTEYTACKFALGLWLIPPSNIFDGMDCVLQVLTLTLTLASARAVHKTIGYRNILQPRKKCDSSEMRHQIGPN